MTGRTLTLLAVTGLMALHAQAEPALAVYRWANGQKAVDEWAAWLGRPAVWGEDFVGNETWDNVRAPNWWLEPWGRWVNEKEGRTLLLGVPILPGPWDRSGPASGEAPKQPVSFAKGAAGEYNERYRILAQNLVHHGLAGKVILRLGWEFNGGWYTWRAKDQEKEFAEYWRQIVKTMRAVPGAETVRFCWNPALGFQQFASENAWPGEEYVDFVGVDVYDESWAQNTYPLPEGAAPEEIEKRRQRAWESVLLRGDHGLAFWSAFAKKHNRPLALPEWGVSRRQDGHGGLDNPYFIEQIHTFLNDAANRVAFDCYFDVQAGDGHHQLSPGKGGAASEFPQAAAKFRELFGQH